MTGLALQIDGKWAVLDDDVSVSIEDNSPVWGDGNSFSLPFSLSVEANRHILGNSDQITGQSVYEVLDGRRAVLYTLGIPVYYGKIKMDDEVEIADGYVDVTLVSGNLTFDEMIDGMNCRDVELKDRIVIGEGLNEFQLRGGLVHLESYTAYFPEDIMHMKVYGTSTINVSKPYPQMPYCNTRICYQKPEKEETSNDATKDYSDVVSSEENKLKLGEYGNYIVLEADRPLSGLCFFVLYFLDCLFYKLKMDYSTESLQKMEDMNRLAFFTTRCKFDYEATNIRMSLEQLQDWVPSFRWRFTGSTGETSVSVNAYRQNLIANSKNFPDVEVSEVINSLKNGFGVRFLYDERFNTMKCVYLKDILRDTEIRTISVQDIYESNKLENNIKGFKLAYSGSDDDTSYAYNEWENISRVDSYNLIRGEVSNYNKKCYIDKRIGNSYRVKVDEEAKTEDELNPSLFEVAEFIPVQYGDCTQEDLTETVEIGFSPIIQNDVAKKAEGKSSDDSQNNTQTFATFLDVELGYPSMVPYTSFTFQSLVAGEYKFQYTYYSSQRESSTSGATYKRFENPVKMFSENALRDFDSGLTLGIMRGPGRKAGTEEFDHNYDGEGNIKYVQVAQDYTFHSDTVDNYARLFDYNGTNPGGVDTSGRFSLKLKGEKPIPEHYKNKSSMTYEDYYKIWSDILPDDVIQKMWDAEYGELQTIKNEDYFPVTATYAQRRGLFDKFYTEYAYFAVNRKIVKMVCRMEMADILNIDWTKRYKIGDYTGFINKYSYTVDSTGMSDVTLEMYYI